MSECVTCGAGDGIPESVRNPEIGTGDPTGDTGGWGLYVDSDAKVLWVSVPGSGWVRASVSAEEVNQAVSSAVAGLVTREYLETTLASYVPSSRMSEYVRTDALNGMGFVTSEGLSAALSGCVKPADLARFATTEYVSQSVAGLASVEWVNGVVRDAVSKVPGSEMFALRSELAGYVTQNGLAGALSGYATKGYVDAAVSGLASADVLSGLVTLDQLRGLGYLTAASLDGYVKGSDLPSMLSGYATADYVNRTFVTPQWITSRGYLRSSDPNVLNTVVRRSFTGVTRELDLDRILAGFTAGDLTTRPDDPPKSSVVKTAVDALEERVGSVMDAVATIEVTSGMANRLLEPMDKVSMTVGGKTSDYLRISDHASNYILADLDHRDQWNVTEQDEGDGPHVTDVALYLVLPSSVNAEVGRNFDIVVWFDGDRSRFFEGLAAELQLGQVSERIADVRLPDGTRPVIRGLDSANPMTLAGVTYGSGRMWCFHEVAAGVFVVTTRRIYRTGAVG